MRKKIRGIRLGPSIVVALPLALLSMLAMAGSNSTTLPNGAALSVSIDDPVTSTEFEVPPGQPSINVPVHGTASVGLGEPDASFVYVMDLSGSTDNGSGAGCAPVLDCEKKFVKALNQAVIDSGSADEVGLAVFATEAATADMSPAASEQLIIAPNAPGVAPFYVNSVVDSTFSVFGGDGGVGLFTPKIVGVNTNCTAGLQAALTVVNATTNGTKIVVFVSDGLCGDPGGGGLAAFNAAIASLATAGAVVDTVAAGSGSSCAGHEVGFTGTLGDIAAGTGGTCFEVADPGNLPDIIPQLIGSTLESLQIAVDGGAAQTIPNGDISLPLPQPGAVSVNYTTPANGLGPGDHTICVTANGSDVTGGTASVTQCETIHLLQLSAAPGEASNQLGSDHQHTVTATIAGPASHIGGRLVAFSVTGQNAGATGTCSPTPDCKTDASGHVSFTYSVPVAPSSLGTDTIHVSTLIAGHTSSVSVIKHWVDTTPPVAACPEGVNPGGKQIPNAHNEDGFFQLTATDSVDPNPSIFVVDLGTGTVFGPFPSGTNVKYTQAPGATPSISPGAGAVNWKIKGQGDMGVYAVDGSGNKSATVSCLVPPPPK
jgi:hypothetical protein